MEVNAQQKHSMIYLSARRFTLIRTRNLVEGHGRLIAVIYVKHDSTHYKNVNKALLNQGVVDLTDYTNNEFNPSSWRLYVSILSNQDKAKFLLISAGFGLIVCLFFNFGFRKISNNISLARQEYDRARNSRE